EAMKTLLDDDRRLDAVFVASDLMADGALRTLRRAGRRGPDDGAGIGFHDVGIARHTGPPLTTVRQPISDLRRPLGPQPVRPLSGEEIEPALILPTELVIRETA